jgi:hypothetical protein
MFSYIGICDFRKWQQASKAVQHFQMLCEKYEVQDRKLMVGVMMSYDTMTGKPSYWTDFWPKNEAVADIFVDHPLAFNTLHYVDYNCNTSTSHLMEAADYGIPYIHAIQLDMVWPPDVIIKGLRRRFLKLKVVLQVNTDALQLVGDKPNLLVDCLKKYEGIVDYVLLDKSIGRGVEMDAEVLLPFALAIAEHLPWLGIAAGGGLGPGTVDLVEPLRKAIPTISWDAQGKLRTSGNSADPLEWDRIKLYLLESVGLYS